MTLAAGGVLHPTLLSPAFRLRNSSLYRNSSSQHILGLHNSSSIQHAFSTSELSRWHSTGNSSVQSRGLRDLVTAGAELESLELENKEEETLVWLTPDTQRKLRTESSEREEQRVSDALESVSSQPWRNGIQFVGKADRQTEEKRARNAELSRRLDTEAGVQNSRVEGWRALGTSTSEPSVMQLTRPYYKRQYRPKTQSFQETERVSGRSRASDFASEKKLDRIELEADNVVESSSSQRGEASGGVSKVDDATRVSRMNGDGDETVNAGFSKSAVSLAGGAGIPYQRLAINLDLQLYWARTLRQRELYDEAATLLRQCIRDWPDDGRPYVALGTLLKKVNKVQEARRVFEDGCQAVRGENAYLWQAWAVLEDRNGNTSKARKLFDAATVADKTHAAAWHGWAVLELREGNYRKGRALLKKGLKFSGPNEYILQTLALTEVNSGRFAQARSLFGKATRANPKSAASWLAWALMEASQDCKTTARNLFKSGIEASPKNRYVWQAWALFEAKDGNKERARQLFQRGQELNPKDPVLFQSHGLFEYNCGHLAIARGLFKQGVAVGPQHQPVWIGWAWVEWKQGNLNKARELFQRAISVDSRTMDAVRAFQAWGILEDREGNVGVARVLFKRALRVDSQNVPTWMSWAAMEERQGNAVRADELRNLCLQQRVEVVDEAPWDVNLNDMLAPAIDKIKGLLNLEQRFPWSKSEGEQVSQSESDVETVQALETRRLEQEFDVDGFLSEKFPWRYGDQVRQRERQESKVAIKRQQVLLDNTVSSRMP